MPTIRKVTRNGQCLWEVNYAGMTRVFDGYDDWNAHRFFEYVTEVYAASSKSQASS